MRFRWNVAPMLALFVFTFGISAFGQDLFGQHDAEHKDHSMTEEKKAAGEKESIY